MDRLCKTLKSLNVVAICLCSLFILSCTPIQPVKTKVEVTPLFEPPVYTGNNLKSYVDEVNWYMLYMFSYTQVLNDYALQRGWKPPMVEPLCRFMDMPTSKPAPTFNPKGGLHGPGFEEDLAAYAKVVSRLYREQSESISANQAFQKKHMCVY